MFSIDAIMSTNLITIHPDASLAEARSLIQENHIHHLPVLDEKGDLAGLISLTNLLAATDSILRDADSRIHAADISVADVMVTDLATVDRATIDRESQAWTSRNPRKQVAVIVVVREHYV